MCLHSDVLLYDKYDENLNIIQPNSFIIFSSFLILSLIHVQ